MGEIKEKHESYGLIGISNTTSNRGHALFGSPIKHNRTIRFCIKEGEVCRNLNQEWFYGGRRIIEIELSSSQFTEMITSLNQGDGVPCTIRKINNRVIEDPPYRGQNQIFNEELESDFNKALNDTDDLIEEATKILSQKGSMGVKDKKELLGKLKSLTTHIKANIPFLYSQFTRSMNKTVSVAKREIDGFYTQVLNKLGKRAIEASQIEKKLPEILGAPKV